MEVDWNKYKYLHYYTKYSSLYAKDFSVITDRILSFVPNTADSFGVASDLETLNGLKNGDFECTNTPGLPPSDSGPVDGPQLKAIVDENVSESISPPPKEGAAAQVERESQPYLKRKLSEVSNAETHYYNNSDSSTESSESCGSDLIFDMKYCSLQLPIPLQVLQEDDFTLETNTSPSITEYDICYDEEVASNYIMVEPFRFLSKVHVTFDKKSGEQWCCCYFDACGNYTRKRFNTSNIAFNTAKMLATRCRDAAEQSFHNIWILKHKNLLNRPIPEKISESFIAIVNKIRGHLLEEDCMVCCVDRIRETLHSRHQHLN